VQKGQSNLFLGGLYALTTAALLATQAPLSFLAAKQLSVAVFIGATELILLLCVPFMLRTRRSREHFVALLSSASNLAKFGVLLLIGLIGIVLYVFGLGRGIRSSSLQSSISTHSGRPSLLISSQVRRSRLHF
jgi:small-conductance mechanosensitive channel